MRPVGEPVHPACAVAVSLDLGDGVPAGARLGIFHPACGEGAPPPLEPNELDELRRRIAELEAKVATGGK